MKLLITGGAGFVGSHAVAHVLENTDWEIVCVDGLTYAGDIGRLTDHEGYDPTRVRTYWHDLRAPIPPTLAARIGDVDVIWNIASESHVDRSIEYPVAFLVGNTRLMANVLEFARQVKPRLLIHCSTDEVYGAALDGYDHREWDPILPSNPYSASKAAQEAACIAWWRTYGVPVVITNTMNMIGERQGGEKFLPRIVTALLKGEPITVHGRKDGKTWFAGSRKYLHARNYADACLWLTKQGYALYGPRPERWNVVGDTEVDNLQLVCAVADILRLEPEIEWVDFHAARPGHDRRYSLDGSKLAEAGWVAPVSFAESLERTVCWLAANLEWLP